MVMRKRKTVRLKEYDYSQAGHYFVTVCAKGRVEWFGHVEDGKMVLNERGVTVERCWNEILRHFPDVDLDAFVVMPNHVHGVIIINPVGNRHACSIQRQYQKLPVIMGSFKSAVSKWIHTAGPGNKGFQWQKSYHDHIIRNEESLQRVREYIANNPALWAQDIENRNRRLPAPSAGGKYYENIIAN